MRVPSNTTSGNDNIPCDLEVLKQYQKESNMDTSLKEKSGSNTVILGEVNTLIGYNAGQPQSIEKLIDSKIENIKSRRLKFLDMAYGYTELKDSHGIADAGMELQALDRTLNMLMELKEEINK